jgi:hypothetical protein
MPKQEITKKQVLLKNVRLSYPSLFTPRGFTDANGKTSEPKFSATLLLGKRTHAKAIKQVEEATKATALEFFNGKIPINCRFCLRDGEEKEDKAGYGEEVMFISASNKTRPQVVDRNPSIPLVEADGKPYAGCYVNALVSFWAYNNAAFKTKGVSANLLAVQFVNDGEPFGETVNAEAVFSDESEEEDGDGLD